MTTLLRSIVRATGLFDRGSEIIVELQPQSVVIRLKGMPTTRHEISYKKLYADLVDRDAKAASAEKARERRK